MSATGAHPECPVGHVRADVRAESGKRKAQSVRRQGGVVLLEVLLAVALFVFAAAVIGAAMSASLSSAADIRGQSKAASLAESVMTEVSSGILELANLPATGFEEPDQDWSYEVTVEEVVLEITGLKRVTVVVRDSDPFSPHVCRLTQWLVDPLADAPTTPPEDGYETFEEDAATPEATP